MRWLGLNLDDRSHIHAGSEWKGDCEGKDCPADRRGGDQPVRYRMLETLPGLQCPDRLEVCSPKWQGVSPLRATRSLMAGRHPSRLPARWPAQEPKYYPHARCHNHISRHAPDLVVESRELLRPIWIVGPLPGGNSRSGWLHSSMIAARTVFAVHSTTFLAALMMAGRRTTRE